MPLGMEVGLDPRDIVLDGDPAPPTQRGTAAVPNFFGPCLLWPNGWTDQDATLCGGRPRRRQHCVRWGSSFPTHGKGHSSPYPIFGPCLLWPNGCIDRDAAWCGVRPRFTRRCARWGPRSSPWKGAQQPPPNFSAHVYCGQTTGRTGVSLGTEVGFGLSDIVFDGDLPASTERAQQRHPIFSVLH